MPEWMRRRRQNLLGRDATAATAASVAPARGSGFLSRSFASLENRNYRRFFVGQSVSLIGTWMQSVAQSWLVLELTGSGTALGLVVAVQTLPVLFLAPYGGLIADRADKRRLLIATQSTLALLALTLGLLDLTHVIRLWMVMLVAAGYGLTNAVDNPTRQAFVSEMVGTDSVGNAVSLNSVVTNAARAIGPAVAGVLIVTAGVGGCFLINAASFIAILLALATMNTSKLHPARAAAHRPGQLLDGLRYVRRTPRLLTPLLMMALIGALAYEFQVVLPLLAKRTFHGNADTYGYLTSAFGLGAVVGGIVVASRRSRGLHSVAIAAFAFGITMLAAASAPTLPLELVALAVYGCCERLVHGAREHDPAASRRRPDARPGDGALGRRVHRHDPCRRPNRRLRRPARRAALGTRSRRPRRPHRMRARRLPLLPPHDPPPAHTRRRPPTPRRRTNLTRRDRPLTRKARNRMFDPYTLGRFR